MYCVNTELNAECLHTKLLGASKRIQLGLQSLSVSEIALKMVNLLSV